jgi:MoxR-like ATPase
LGEAAGVVGAQAGFNIIATANIRDRGVHEMSAALKRRFNFETVPPIPDLKQEIELVRRESQRLLEDAAVDMAVPAPVVELLVTTFRDLRDGVTEEGIQVERPTTVLSTAEAVSVCLAAGLDAHYFGDGAIAAQHLARNLVGAVFKDQEDDLAKWKHYVAKVVRQRAEAVSAGSGDPAIDWPGLYAARRQFPAG